MDSRKRSKTYFVRPIYLLDCTLAVISADRLLALVLGLRYRQVVTLKRTYVIVIVFWILCTVCSVVWFWSPAITLWSGITVTSLCLVTAVFSYIEIFLNLRHHHSQVQNHAQQANPTNQINTARYKKAVCTAIWLQLTMVACYLPYGVMTALQAKSGITSSFFHARIYTSTLVFLNSSLNPILYCWKLDEVRQTVNNAIRQICLCFSS